MKKVSIFLTVIVILLSSCTIKLKSGKKTEGAVPDFIMGDFQYTSFSGSGKREWVLKSSEAKMFDSSSEIFLYNMTMTFYNPNNVMQSFLSSDEGYVNKKNKNVTATGNVKIFSENGAVLICKKVFWDNANRIFYSDTNEQVTLIQGKTVIKGYRMKADSGLKQVQILDVTGAIKK
ncbi:MAG: LPS export ABC transporter periplasmic protein LptC [Spirochaetes bacterium GWF1_51_8]|nr:MAG: LPS export ABC transporter periplasmic protein LptC [Spirochaetes bacterium GWF1_51_8]